MYTYRAALIRIIDGDTIECSVDLGFSIYKHELMRLYGINTPEKNSKDPTERAAAIAAQLYLTTLLTPVFTIKTHKDKSDKYGRMLVEILLPDGTLVNEQMIAQGHAERYFP